VDEQTLEALAELVCGDDREKHPLYRTGGELTRFFNSAGLGRELIQDDSAATAMRARAAR